MYRNLNPGGYIEISDITFPIKADDDTLSSESALVRWSDLMLKASKILDRPLDSAESYGHLLENAGFSEIVESEYKWPQNRWPRDPKFKELGEPKLRSGKYNRIDEKTRHVDTCGRI